MAEQHSEKKAGGFPNEELRQKFLTEHVETQWDEESKVATVTVKFYCPRPPCPLSGA